MNNIQKQLTTIIAGIGALRTTLDLVQITQQEILKTMTTTGTTTNNALANLDAEQALVDQELTQVAADIASNTTAVTSTETQIAALQAQITSLQATIASGAGTVNDATELADAQAELAKLQAIDTSVTANTAALDAGLPSTAAPASAH
jgi:chromosome segregation ATPase